MSARANRQFATIIAPRHSSNLPGEANMHFNRRGKTTMAVSGAKGFSSPIDVASGQTLTSDGSTWTWTGPAAAVVLRVASGGTIKNLVLSATGCTVSNSGTAVASTLNGGAIT